VERETVQQKSMCSRSLKSVRTWQVWQQLEAAIAEQQRQREDGWMPVVHELRRRTLLSRHFVSVRWYASWRSSKRRALQFVVKGRALSSRQHLLAWWQRIRQKTDQRKGLQRAQRHRARTLCANNLAEWRAEARVAKHRDRSKEAAALLCCHRCACRAFRWWRALAVRSRALISLRRHAATKHYVATLAAFFGAWGGGSSSSGGGGGVVGFARVWSDAGDAVTNCAHEPTRLSYVGNRRRKARLLASAASLCLGNAYKRARAAAGGFFVRARIESAAVAAGRVRAAAAAVKVKWDAWHLALYLSARKREHRNIADGYSAQRLVARFWPLLAQGCRERQVRSPNPSSLIPTPQILNPKP
jgi:hypothetical protein